MKKDYKSRTLILSYYFPPLTGAPAWRAFSWARFFHAFDVDPVILTRHWSGNETTWAEHVSDLQIDESYEEMDTYSVWRVPSRKYRAFHSSAIGKNPLVRKFYFSFLHLAGFFNTEVNAYLTFKDKLIELLKSSQFDTVVLTGPPPNIYRLVNVVREHSSAKVILDYRDLSNNAVLSISEKHSFKDRWMNERLDAYEARWMDKADLVTTVAPAFKKYLEKLTQTPVEVVYNGYDNDYFDSIATQLPDKFTISFVGAIYPYQSYDQILDGLAEFLRKNPGSDIAINGIGVLMIEKVAEKFRAKLKDTRVYLSKRVSKEEAIRYVKNAHCLLFTSWDNRPGMIPAKFYDFIASGTYVINCPGDQNIIDQIVTETGVGDTMSSAGDVEDKLQELYNLWKEKKSWTRQRNESAIQRYSRKNQAARMAELICKLHAGESQNNDLKV